MDKKKVIRIDSSMFDLRTMNSSAITLNTPIDLGSGLASYLDDFIQALPEDEEDKLEIYLRSIVNILVISKLQSEESRAELDRVKYLIQSGMDFILSSKVVKVGVLNVINIDQWTIISLAASSLKNSSAIINNISEVIDQRSMGKHVIFDFSCLVSLDIHLSAYLIGLQSMFAGLDKKISIAWLPKSSTIEVSNNLIESLISRFKLFSKGSYLLSHEPKAA